MQIWNEPERRSAQHHFYPKEIGKRLHKRIGGKWDKFSAGFNLLIEDDLMAEERTQW